MEKFISNGNDNVSVMYYADNEKCEHDLSLKTWSSPDLEEMDTDLVPEDSWVLVEWRYFPRSSSSPLA